MQKLSLSTIEESIEVMGNPYATIQIKDRSESEIKELRTYFNELAKTRGFPSLVWKRDETNLYAF